MYIATTLKEQRFLTFGVDILYFMMVTLPCSKQSLNMTVSFKCVEPHVFSKWLKKELLFTVSNYQVREWNTYINVKQPG